MAQQKPFLQEMATTPWWFGLLTGAVGAVIILLFGPFLLDNAPALAGQSLGAALRPLVVPGAIAFFLLCGLSAGRSWAAARHRARLLRTHTQLDQLRTMSWQDFERLVGEAFRTQGYHVTESGLGGADGGVDLVLHRGGQRTLVQCKRWANRSVGVATVRELAGVLAHDDAVAAILVTTSTYTLEAKTFAANKPITLIDGEELLGLVTRANAPQAPATHTGDTDEVTAPGRTSVAPGAAPGTSPEPLPAAAPVAPSQQPSPRDPVVTASPGLPEPAAAAAAPDAEPTATPACPRCGSPMVTRTNKSSGQSFWGCSTFPRCRGTLQAG